MNIYILLLCSKIIFQFNSIQFPVSPSFNLVKLRSKISDTMGFNNSLFLNCNESIDFSNRF